ncbi:MAG: DUF433 domain-containing protein [Dehalococcoidia bacterium]
MAAVTPVDIGTLIETRPGFRGGRPVITGTGTHVHALAALYRDRMSADEIADEYEHLPRSHVFAAIAYYLANSEEIAGYLAEEARAYEQGRAEMGPSPLVRKYLGR